MSEMLCRNCSHDSQLHTHLRRGTDCALCECPRMASSAIDVVMIALASKRHRTVKPAPVRLPHVAA